MEKDFWNDLNVKCWKNQVAITWFFVIVWAVCFCVILCLLGLWLIERTPEFIPYLHLHMFLFSCYTKLRLVKIHLNRRFKKMTIKLLVNNSLVHCYCATELHSKKESYRFSTNLIPDSITFKRSSGLKNVFPTVWRSRPLSHCPVHNHCGYMVHPSIHLNWIL